MKNTKKQLQNIIDNQPNTLKAYVAKEAIESDDIKAFFEGLQQHGCISGWIASLIFYTDTHQFFDNYYDEIEELRQDNEEHLKIKGDLKNTLAWFAFEETAYQLCLDLFPK